MVGCAAPEPESRWQRSAPPPRPAADFPPGRALRQHDPERVFGGKARNHEPDLNAAPRIDQTGGRDEVIPGILAEAKVLLKAVRLEHAVLAEERTRLPADGVRPSPDAEGS